jgi:hypothetical protein
VWESLNAATATILQATGRPWRLVPSMFAGLSACSLKNCGYCFATAVGCIFLAIMILAEPHSKFTSPGWQCS